MAGRRVLVSGMGGELGARIARLLEDEPWVGSIEGIDVDPPRRRLHRTVFHRIVPGEHDRTVETVTAFDPHLVVHVAVWEPHARAGIGTARSLTDEAATSILGAAAECPSLEGLIVRSGIEIYGRQRGSVTRPTEAVAPAPTSTYGKMVADIERIATSIGRRVGVTVGALRLASVLGPHVPSPLGRVLRLAAVPYSATADPGFVVVHQNDAAAAFVAAARHRLDRPLNIAASGAVTASQAIRRGRRIPVPLLGPEWAIARAITHLAGAPIPDHVIEMLHRGRLADNSQAADAIGWRPEHTTSDVIDELFAWPTVIRIPPHRTVA